MIVKLVYLDSSSIVKRHIEEKQANCNLLSSADAKLIQTAQKEDTNALNLETETEKALKALR